jgi:hypothetical protein
MNASKTKAMKINSKINTKLEVNGNITEETETFQYLGSLVKLNGEAEEDAKNRISKANSAFSQLYNKLYGEQDIYHGKQKYGYLSQMSNLFCCLDVRLGRVQQKLKEACRHL